MEHLPDCFARPSSFRHCFLNPNRSFRVHLSLALPTEIIFNLLRSIRSERLASVPGYPVESLPVMLDIIIEWLQVSVSECNRQTPQTKNLICV